MKTAVARRGPWFVVPASVLLRYPSFPTEADAITAAFPNRHKGGDAVFRVRVQVTHGVARARKRPATVRGDRRRPA